MQLNQVKALVTGGVSGLGLAVTRHIIANGGKATLLDINDEAGAAAEAELGARYIRTNVTSEDGVVASVEAEAVRRTRTYVLEPQRLHLNVVFQREVEHPNLGTETKRGPVDY